MSAEQKLFNELYQSIVRDGKVMYLGYLLQRTAQQFPNTIALICRDVSIPYRALYYYASLLSNQLIKQGIKPKDRILLFFENSIEFYVGYFAIIQIGAVVVPVNTFLRERELAHIINDAKPTMIIASSDLAERLHKTDVDNMPPLLTEKDMDLASAPPITLPSFDVIALDSDEMVALLYTSGTTGLPKGVMLSSKNIMTNIIQMVARFGFVTQERVFGVLPLFHSFAQNICVWSSIFLGCTVIVVPKIDRRYILEGLQHKPTIFFGVPALYGLMCLLKNAPLDSVKYFFSGGDALPDRIHVAFKLLYRRKICSGYGLTETSPVVTTDLEDVASATNTIGLPLIGIECLLKDEEGNEVPPGQVGEIWVKGDNVMLGYYNDPDMTADVLREGWLRTGDLAYVDKKGKLVISGRIKDLIIHKGLNIYPQEIENIILSHPNVVGVGVIGHKDIAVGEVPIAYVQIKKKEEHIEQALKKLCIKNLAPYKVPRTFICSTQSLPVTATGKVDKKVLRAQEHAK